MKTLNSMNINLLDKIYNLRGSDSVILASMDKEMNETLDSKSKIITVKEELQEKISTLTESEKRVKAEGYDLLFNLTSLCQNDYSFLLEKLELDFNPNTLLSDLNNKLPNKLEVLGNEIKMNNNELSKVEDKLSELLTRIEELNIRKEEALVEQESLKHYIELALNNDINVTRDELSLLFSKFGFNDEEQKELAKMFMFPEDGLLEYDKNINNKENLSLNQIETEPVVEEKNPIEIENTDNFEINNIDFSNPDDIINSFIDESSNNSEVNFDSSYVNMDSFKDDAVNFEPISFDFNLPTYEDIKEENTNVVESIDKTTVIEKLKSLGFDELDFTPNDIEIITNNYNEDVINKNVELISNLNIKKDVFFDNVELLVDSELSDKILSLTNVGKLPKDIYLYPNVLTKYNLSELDSAIKLLEESGLEPKNVPLMAY